MNGSAATISFGGQMLTVNLANYVAENGALADEDDLAAAIQASANYENMDWTVEGDATNSYLNFTFKEFGDQVGKIEVAGLYSTPEVETIQNGVDPVDPDMVDQGSIMYLTPDRADTYQLAITNNAGGSTTGNMNLSWDGTQGNLDGIASILQGRLNNDLPGNWEVTNAGGTLKINDLDGGAFSISGFSSTGAGRMTVANNEGQQGAGPSMAILDDTQYDVGATTQGAGVADQTKMSMTFDANDIYSFTITDGTTTASIADVGTGNKAGSGSIDDMLAAVEAALDRSGLATTVSVGLSDNANELVFTHDLGSRLKVDNFKSENSGVVEIRSADQATEGFSKYLDDGGSAAKVDRVSEINFSTADGAEAALDIIDRALADITSQRAELGAISNRLDHTISNLGNVIVNTEASQSRIEDVDFAKVTADLTKSQIMSQAATAMLAQANASKQGVLSLLQG